MTTSIDSSPLAQPPATDTKPPWYRRRNLIVAAAVIVVLAVTVVTDLPAKQSRSNDISVARSTITEIETDVAPCNLGMSESLTFYSDVSTGHITNSERGQIPGLIREDLDACSFTNESIIDLASVEVSNDRAGRELNTLASRALTWCDPASLTAIGEITKLIAASRTPPKDVPKLVAEEGQLTVDRKAVYASVAALEQTLDTKSLPSITLVRAP